MSPGRDDGWCCHMIGGRPRHRAAAHVAKRSGHPLSPPVAAGSVPVGGWGPRVPCPPFPSAAPASWPVVGLAVGSFPGRVWCRTGSLGLSWAGTRRHSEAAALLSGSGAVLPTGGGGSRVCCYNTFPGFSCGQRAPLGGCPSALWGWWPRTPYAAWWGPGPLQRVRRAPPDNSIMCGAAAGSSPPTARSSRGSSPPLPMSSSDSQFRLRPRRDLRYSAMLMPCLRRITLSRSLKRSAQRLAGAAKSLDEELGAQ